MYVTGGLSLPPDFLERYRPQRVLGAGTAGTVLLAFDMRHERAVAVKVLMRLEDEDLRRFENEAQLLSAVRDPGIVEILGAGTAGEHPYLVTEYLDGGTLRERLAATPALAPADAVRIALEVLGALAACHRAGVVHRDVKPENILFDARGRAKLADLGIARLHEQAQRLTRTGALVGTPRYMSPEQLHGADAGPPTDLHAVGLILHEMLSGQPAFPQPNLADLLEAKSRPPGDLASLAPTVPAPLAAIVSQACALYPEQRPDSAQELSRLLLDALLIAESAPPAPADPLGSEHVPTLRFRKPRPRAELAAVTLAALPLIFMLVNLYTPPSHSRPSSVTVSPTLHPPRATVHSPLAAVPSPPATPAPSAPLRAPRPSISAFRVSRTPATTPAPLASASLIHASLTSSSSTLQALTPSQRAIVRAHLHQLARVDSAPTGARLTSLVKHATPLQDDHAFYDRLTALRSWWGHTPQGLAIIESLQYELYVNPVQAARRLDRCLLSAAADGDPDHDAVRAALEATGAHVTSPPPPTEDLALDFLSGRRAVEEGRALLARRDSAHTGAFTRALAPLARAARADHRRAEALFLLGTALLLRDLSSRDLEKSAELLARSAALAEDAWTLLRLAQAQMLCGRTRDARASIAGALRLAPDWPEAHVLAALLEDTSPAPDMQRARQHLAAAARHSAAYRDKVAPALRHSRLAERAARAGLALLDDHERGALAAAQIGRQARRASADPVALAGVAALAEAVSDALMPERTARPLTDPPGWQGGFVEGISLPEK